MFPLRKKYKITDLKIPEIFRNRKALRERFKIVIIDDEEFPSIKKENLENRGFNITTLRDCSQANLLADYPIVISDVNGVAKDLDPEKQGIALITQIVKQYPYKAVGIYSGHPRLIPTLPASVVLINKDDNVDAWEEKIDELIDRISSPKRVWQKLAKILIDNEIPAEQIADIEDDFVHRVLKRKSFIDFPATKYHLETNTLSVLNGVVSNGIFFGLTKMLGV